MNQESGRMFNDETMKKLFPTEQKSSKEIGERFSRFAVGEHISWKKCSFVILEIKTDPINQIILQGVEK